MDSAMAVIETTTMTCNYDRKISYEFKFIVQPKLIPLYKLQSKSQRAVVLPSTLLLEVV